MWRKLNSPTAASHAARSWAMLDAVDVQFRAILQMLGCWSPQADQLFALMARTEPAVVTTQEKLLLPQVAQAVLARTDIGVVYPKFYRQLLVNPLLRQAFVQQITQLQPDLNEP
ncbi:MAG: hypothetical protein R3E31_11575 [Chloroflexota bacterium]